MAAGWLGPPGVASIFFEQRPVGNFPLVNLGLTYPVENSNKAFVTRRDLIRSEVTNH